MRETDVRGRRALVTGASSGLGADFARELAERGCHSVLVARREHRLTALAAELRHEHGVEADVVPLDLRPSRAPESLHEVLRERGLEVDVLINNAGFGIHGDFLEMSWERERAMLELDILSLVHLTKLFARDMVKRGFGRILQVSSLGAFQPVPSYATYSAAKAFVLMFGESVNHELKGTGVTCTVLAPGTTATEFQEVAGHAYTEFMRRTMMQSRTVARVGIRALLREHSSVVPGMKNRILSWSVRLVPRPMAAAIADALMRKRSRE